MNDFVFISQKYRDAVAEEITPWGSFPVQYYEEVEFIKRVGRPPWSYYNDMFGENNIMFKMRNDYYDPAPFEYTDDLPSFYEICIERAKEMRDMNKEIDILYSAGMDSTLVFLALYEVCPKDQLHIIMGEGHQKDIYPKLWEERIKHLNYTISEPLLLFSQPRPDKNLFTTGCEADRLFGGTGFPEHGMGIRPSFVDESDKHHYDTWWEKTRYTFIMQSFRYLQDIKCPKMDMNNYQPFFLFENFQRFAMNKIINRNMVWHSNQHKMEFGDYLAAKMDLREFIAEIYDEDYAYDIGKTVMFSSKPPGWKSYGYGVEAIYGDGTVIFTEDMYDNLGYGINI